MRSNGENRDADQQICKFIGTKTTDRLMVFSKLRGESMLPFAKSKGLIGPHHPELNDP